MIELSNKFWEEKYEQGGMGWDIGFASPPIKNYIDQFRDLSLPILIPGCGNAYEAVYLLEKGAKNVVLLDYAAQPVTNARIKFQKYGEKVKVLQEDFFDHQGQYALILEQTFFCAIDPELRTKYVEKMYELLMPGGKLAGVLFNRSFENSPPYGGNKEEYEKLFSEKFSLIRMYPEENSIPPRAGSELFFEVSK